MNAKRKCLFIIFCLFYCIVSAQQNTIKGIIRDAQTNEYIANAIISSGTFNTISDEQGHFSIVTGDYSELTISMIGYRSQKIKLNRGENNIEIELYKTFIELNDTKISATKFNIDSLFIKAANQVSENYLPSTHILNTLFSAQLFDAGDTLVSINKNIFLYNSDSEWFNYKKYDVPDLEFDKRGMVDFKTLQNYMPNVKGIMDIDMKHSLLENADNIVEGLTDKKLESFVTTFIGTDSEKYYDVVFINPIPQSVNYSAILKAAGYSKRKSENAERKYIALSETQMDATTYAIIFYRNILIESNDSDSDFFVRLQDRNKIEDWLNDAFSNNRKFQSYSYKFDKQMGKYCLKYFSYHDNLIHPMLRNAPLQDYTYVINYSFVGICNELPPNCEKFSPQVFLYQNVVKKKGN